MENTKTYYTIINGEEVEPKEYCNDDIDKFNLACKNAYTTYDEAANALLEQTRQDLSEYMNN